MQFSIHSCRCNHIYNFSTRFMAKNAPLSCESGSRYNNTITKLVAKMVQRKSEFVDGISGSRCQTGGHNLPLWHRTLASDSGIRDASFIYRRLASQPRVVRVLMSIVAVLPLSGRVAASIRYGAQTIRSSAEANQVPCHLDQSRV